MFRCSAPLITEILLISTKVNATLSLLIVGAEHRNIRLRLLDFNNFIATKFAVEP